MKKKGTAPFLINKKGAVPFFKKYNAVKIRLRLAGIILTVLYLAVFQAFISFPLKAFAFSLTSDFYSALAICFILFSVLHYAINFPMRAYSAFILEHKFKLSNMSFTAWIKDDIKSGLLSLFMFLIFIQALYMFLRSFTETWWVWIAGFWFVATVILAKITPVFIIPLFFKYSPVGSGLKKKIIELSETCGIKVMDVYKIDFSKKTNKLNAAVVGMGNTRRVILADNMVREFNDEEVLGVLAHEFGHHKSAHMRKLLTFGFVSTFLSFYVLYVLSRDVVIFLNASTIYDIGIFPALLLILFIAGFIILPLQNAFSRRLERKADLFALEVTKNNAAFISLMNKLAEKNLADPNPSKLIKLLFYDHPPVSERIQLAKRHKTLYLRGIQVLA